MLWRKKRKKKKNQKEKNSWYFKSGWNVTKSKKIVRNWRNAATNQALGNSLIEETNISAITQYSFSNGKGVTGKRMLHCKSIRKDFKVFKYISILACIYLSYFCYTSIREFQHFQLTDMSIISVEMSKPCNHCSTYKQSDFSRLCISNPFRINLPLKTHLVKYQSCKWIWNLCSFSFTYRSGKRWQQWNQADNPVDKKECNTLCHTSVNYLQVEIKLFLVTK